MIVSKKEPQVLKNADHQNRYWQYTRYTDLVWGAAALFFSYRLVIAGTEALDWSAKLEIALLFAFGFATLSRLRNNRRNDEVRLLLNFASESQANAA